MRRKNLKEYYEKTAEVVTRCKARRQDLIKGNHLNEEVWAEVFGESSFHLDDGWARIFALSKTGILHILKKVRLEESWLKALCQEVTGFKAMTKWPLGSLAKSNPWRVTYFPQLVVQAPLVDKVTGQYKVVFPARKWDGPRVTPEELCRLHKLKKGKDYEKFEGTSVFFEGGVFESEGMTGWVVPRHQQKSRLWTKADGSLKPPKKSKVWVPELNDEELNLLLEGDKPAFIRYLHQKYADDLKNKVICVMDIKTSVEELLTALD